MLVKGFLLFLVLYWILFVRDVVNLVGVVINCVFVSFFGLGRSDSDVWRLLVLMVFICDIVVVVIV